MKILSVLLEITPNLDTRAIETPLSSPKGTMWCLWDLTPFSWCKMDAHSTDFASNWLEHLPAGSISTWEDLTTRFLAQFFPSRRTVKLRNDILIRTIDQSAGGKLHDRNAKESWTLLEDLALYDNKSWNDPRDFAKPVKEISLPQDVLSTSDCRLIELENQVQRLTEAHLAPKQYVQVNKITFSCEICSGPHDTQYCMENP
ncbi:MAK10-like protein [Tanacetum coccineum]